MNHLLETLATQVALKIFQAKPLFITPIVGLGDVNSVFILTMDAGKYVIRINTDGDVDGFRKASWCIRQAIQLGIPSPVVIEYGAFENAVYEVQTFVEGDNGSIMADKSHIWMQLGRYAKLIHAVPVQGYGEDWVDAQHNQFSGSWQGFVTYNIESLTEQDVLRALNVLTRKTSDRLREAFQVLLDTPFTFGLNHGDLSEKNTLVNRDRKVYLLDWDSAEAHIVPHFDLIGILGWNLAPESHLFQMFLEGYGMSQAEFARMKPELDLLNVLLSIDKLRWAIDRKPEKITEFADRVKRNLRSLPV